MKNDDKQTSQKTCPVCNGKKEVYKPVPFWSNCQRKLIYVDTLVRCSTCDGRGYV